jgi:hypothetical protein
MPCMSTLINAEQRSARPKRGERFLEHTDPRPSLEAVVEVAALIVFPVRSANLVQYWRV